MNAEKYERLKNILHYLTKFKEEKNIIADCLNKSVKQDNIQIEIKPSNFVIIRNIINNSKN